MYLSRITPVSSSRQLSRLAALASAGPYGIHQALWRLFDRESDSKRDFLFRQLGDTNKLAFYLLSPQQPGTDEGLWNVEAKQFAPNLREGQLLNFSVRINPVVKRRDDADRQVRHDVVMDLKQQDRSSGNERRQAERVQQAAVTWLEKRQRRNGYTLRSDSVLGEAYCQHRFRGKGNRQISLSTIDCEGLLSVKDPELFQETLTTGLGPGKAFGCGLVLIRPA